MDKVEPVGGTLSDNTRSKPRLKNMAARTGHASCETLTMPSIIELQDGAEFMQALVYADDVHRQRSMAHC